MQQPTPTNQLQPTPMGIEETYLPSNIVCWGSMDGRCSDRGRMSVAL
jgi:hypothetical protein